MKNSLQLNVAQPCHENWSAMTPQEQGRFCGSCSKMVVDFSVMTDKQILDYFSSYSGSTCGRFTNDQLNRAITSEVQKPKGWFKYAVGLMLPALFIANKSYTQGKPQANEKACTQTPAQKKNVKTGKNKNNVPKVEEMQATVGIVLAYDSAYEPPPPLKIMEDTIVNPVVADVSDVTLGKIRFDKDIVIPAVTNIEFVRDTVVFSDSISYTTLGFFVDAVIIEEEPVFAQFKRFVADSLTGNAMKLYPNPARPGATINISYKLSKGNYYIQVLDMSGRVLQQESISLSDDAFNIPFRLQNHFASGQYMVLIANDKRKKIGAKPIVVL